MYIQKTQTLNISEIGMLHWVEDCPPKIPGTSEKTLFGKAVFACVMQ